MKIRRYCIGFDALGLPHFCPNETSGYLKRGRKNPLWCEECDKRREAINAETAALRAKIDRMQADCEKATERQHKAELSRDTLTGRIKTLEAALAAARFRFEYLASEAMRLEMPIARTMASEGALAAHKALEAKDG